MTTPTPSAPEVVGKVELGLDEVVAKVETAAQPTASAALATGMPGSAAAELELELEPELESEGLVKVVCVLGG